MYVKQAELEHKLFKLCTWAKEHAHKSIKELKKKHLFEQCAEMVQLRSVAETYLANVSQEDVAYVNEKAQKAAAAKALALLKKGQSNPNPRSTAQVISPDRSATADQNTDHCIVCPDNQSGEEIDLELD